MKNIIVAVLILLTSCKIFTKTEYVDRVKEVTVYKEKNCDSLQQWSDTLWFVIPCDSFVVDNSSDRGQTHIESDGNKVKGQIITKQLKPRVIYVNRDSLVYQNIEKPIYCDKWHVKQWQVWTFFISLLANILCLIFLFKKYVF